MNHRKIALIAAAAVLLAPAISNASPEKSALDACARAFAASLASPGAAAPAYKVSYRGHAESGSVIEFYNHEFSFDMHANNQKTGQTIAHASCSTDNQGNVLGLSSVPLTAQR